MFYRKRYISFREGYTFKCEPRGSFVERHRTLVGRYRSFVERRGSFVEWCGSFVE